jgi:hypothetical protein
VRMLATRALEAWTEATGAVSHLSRHSVVTFRDAGGAVGRRDRATHLLHWYPAKMFYRIPDQILQTLRPGSLSVILDPFCGSGTVLVEGIARGYSTIGIDINPLARLISRVPCQGFGGRFARDQFVKSLEAEARGLNCGRISGRRNKVVM